jgi:hypothetical protein
MNPPGRFVAGLALVLAAGITGARGVSYYLATDVPATLGGADYTPDQIARSDNASYAPELSIGDQGFAFLAMHRRPDGLWLLVPATPSDEGGGSSIEARDAVLYDGVNPPTLYFKGAAAGVPAEARIDALFLDETGALVLSFDVPVALGGTTYSQSDLVRYDAGVFTLYFDAEAAGVPADGNIVGADRDGAGRLVVTFDVPTLVGGTTFPPGELVAWTGVGFSTYFSDPAWPESAQLRDFAFVPAAGAIPDGVLPGVPLMVTRTGTDLNLSWGASCLAGDTDFEVYEGTVGSWYSHTSKFCTTGGATSISFPEPAGNVYYLVVPRNALSEGSYGHASNLSERPQGAAACLPQQVAAQCP